MKAELKEFINSQDEELRPTLYKYYDLYLELRANGDNIKASNDVLRFLKRNQGELYHLVDHEIDKIENNNFIVARGLKRKRKRNSEKSRTSKKSRKTKLRRPKSITPFNLSNADLYIIILLRRIIEYNKGNLSVTK